MAAFIPPTGSAASRYRALDNRRRPYLDRARKAAKLTIPSLYPPEGSSEWATLEVPYQSVGARGVNNIAARMMLSLLPPNQPFFKYALPASVLTQLVGNDEARGEVEAALNGLVEEAQAHVESQNIRPTIYQMLRLLVVGGNVLLHVPEKVGESTVRAFSLAHYVATRGPGGDVIELMLAEELSAQEMPPDVLTLAYDNPDEALSSSELQAVPLYTWLRFRDGVWMKHQEIRDKIVPGSEGTYAKENFPYIVLRFTKVDGEHYGHGMVEDCYGDLVSLDALDEAVVEGSLAAAKVVIMVAPNGVTKKETIRKSKNLDVIVGRKDDVSVLQLEKFPDFKVAADKAKELERSLEMFFLLHSSIQRNGERVTAEEIKYLAQELEASLGGIYSLLAAEFQLPFVRLILRVLTTAGKIPKLPPNLLNPSLVTGLEAIGRGNDLAKLQGFGQDVGGVAQYDTTVLKRVNAGELLKRLAAARGIATSGLIITDDEFAQAQQAEMANQAISTAAPGVMQEAAATAMTPPT